MPNITASNPGLLNLNLLTHYVVLKPSIGLLELRRSGVYFPDV